MIANQAVRLASERIGDVNPETDNNELVDEIQHHLLRREDAAMAWARDLPDPTRGARTKDEMLNVAADSLTWGLSQDAVDVMAAMRREGS